MGGEARPRLPGVSWQLRVWPDSRPAGRDALPLPELALVLGGLLGLLLEARACASPERPCCGRGARPGAGRGGAAGHGADGRAAPRQREAAERRSSERARAEQALGDLSGRLLRLQDEERRRLARELHDSTAQVLGAAAIGLDRARRCLGGGQAELGSLLEDTATHLEQVTQEIRTLSFLLHPPMLDDLGLEYALPWYVEGFGRRSGIAVRLDVPASWDGCRRRSS